jgi:hypothetical protein
MIVCAHVNCRRLFVSFSSGKCHPQVLIEARDHAHCASIAVVMYSNDHEDGLGESFEPAADDA